MYRRSSRHALPVQLLWVAGVLLLLGGCRPAGGPAPAATPVPVTPASPSAYPGDGVTIVESTIEWETYQYELAPDNSIRPGSFDGATRTRQTFTTWVLENQYLRVTLLPELGGRIISLIYKPTGHEQLYRNPVGVPYQIGTGIFYYDWLMVYGGIFPTFPEPEHGKSWLLPWDFEIVSATADEVVVAMSLRDDVDRPAAPRQYDLGATGLLVTYTVALRARRAALDTNVRIENPTAQPVNYEYWTVATLAPGSSPTDPRTTAAAEIVAPVATIKIPGYWRAIAAQEKPTGLIDVYEFAALRRFEAWPDMGIAYAFPDMRGANFWGVINHDRQEGLFRVADNHVTPGLKLWTWGYPLSTGVDPRTDLAEARPYIELWGGVTREFWQRSELGAGEQLTFDETYLPSVGLGGVTHASPDLLVDIDTADGTVVGCRFFGMLPEQPVDVVWRLDGAEISRETVRLDPLSDAGCAVDLDGRSPDSLLELAVVNAAGETLFTDAVEFADEQ